MVDQIPMYDGAHTEPTLYQVWHGLAARLSRGAAAACVTGGIAAALSSRWAGLPWVVTLSAVIVIAFGCDALLHSGAVASHGPRARMHRVASAGARAVAATAAVAIALIVLGMIFGDKIEVMRR